MNVVHETVGQPPPPNAIPVASYRPYTVTLSLTAEEQNALYKAAACSSPERAAAYAGTRGLSAGNVLYSAMAGIYYCLRDQGETL